MGLLVEGHRSLYLVSVVSIGGTAAVAPALDSIREGFERTSGEAALVVSLYLLPGALVAPGIGALALRWGSGGLVRISLWGFGISALACALAPSFAALLAFRIIQGAFGGALLGGAVALLGDLFEREGVARAIATNEAWVSLAAGLWPAVGGTLSSLHWRGSFMPQILALALVGLYGGLIPGKVSDRPEGKVDEARHPKRRRTYFLGIVCMFVVSMGVGAVYYYVVPFVFLPGQPVMAGWTLSGMGLVAAGASAGIGKLRHRIGLRAAMGTSLALMGCGFFLLPATEMGYAVLALIAIAQGIAFPSMKELITVVFASAGRGLAANTTEAVGATGRSLGPVYYSQGESPTGHGAAAALLAAVLAVLGAIAFASRGNERRGNLEEL